MKPFLDPFPFRVPETRSSIGEVIAEITKAEEKKVEAFRIKANIEKRKVESSTLSAKCNILRRDLIPQKILNTSPAYQPQHQRFE